MTYLLYGLCYDNLMSESIILIGLSMTPKKTKRKRHRKVWLKSWLEKRSSSGHGELFRELVKFFLQKDEQLLQNLVVLV